MSIHRTIQSLCAAAIIAASTATVSAAPSTSVNYQGLIRQNNALVNGSLEFRFSLWDSQSLGSGSQIGGSIQASVDVEQGLFSADLDFGAQAYGQEDRWLQIEVREPGDATYTAMGERQRLSASPFALQTRGIFVNAEGAVETSGIQIQKTDSNSPVGITQEVVGGPATMELTTTDTDGDQTPRLVLRGDADQSNVEFYRGGFGSETLTLLINGANGRVGIGTNNPQDMLDVNGIIRSGGVRLVGGADIAEPFDITSEHQVLPGMVVAIDPLVPGSLRVSDESYDATVAGIVSGANGINPALTLSQEGTIADGEHPVALTGRVWCLVDADANGPISAGDMLTTSETYGHAMRADDRSRAFGATIGKAMTTLESGRGYVLVLVNLQ